MEKISASSCAGPQWGMPLAGAASDEPFGRQAKTDLQHRTTPMSATRPYNRLWDLTLPSAFASFLWRRRPPEPESPITAAVGRLWKGYFTGAFIFVLGCMAVAALGGMLATCCEPEPTRDRPK